MKENKGKGDLWKQILEETYSTKTFWFNFMVNHGARNRMHASFHKSYI